MSEQEQQTQQQTQQEQGGGELQRSAMGPPPSPKRDAKTSKAPTQRDAALGPLRSHRTPLPNEMAELTPEEQPGGGSKGDEHSLSINIALDLLVEVHLTARVKGDVTIGLL
ncbi:hypothetical protein L202_00875 [Cryptococcus amylolentus CBS 6039]|uniref:Uncharacterized protein n=2 Tax=Cryptococcus amylolentus TaxID=104669 RepID=A0A1E3I9H7_9TREE|nr:hypothetical protein L202_00875 [Cryptococcus amylolentus CBS 6039]ODN85045.1 hypothetical protein L202_00875 [Cryptococcus amylolentus CBS 6039]ODO11276.1 hypothetical protein I350_00051 [Cryptococcus amylolentus CBS 6273]